MGIALQKNPDLNIINLKEQIAIADVKSNFSEVKKLAEDFKIICSTFCEKNESINKRLKNIEAKDELKQ